METLSITISPRGDVPLDWGETINKYFTSKNWKFYIGKEKGKNNNDHLQIAVETPFRSDNIRRSFIKLLKPDFEDDHEKRCWLKISKTDDKAYTFGYCMKEKDDFYTSLTNEEIKDYKDYYTKKQGSKKPVGWECKGINQLLDYCLEFARKNDLIERNIKLRSIVVILVNDGLIPFSLGRKIKKDDELFWNDIINMELSKEFDTTKTPVGRINMINDYYD